MINTELDRPNCDPGTCEWHKWHATFETLPAKEVIKRGKELVLANMPAPQRKCIHAMTSLKDVLAIVKEYEARR